MSVLKAVRPPAPPPPAPPPPPPRPTPPGFRSHTPAPPGPPRKPPSIGSGQGRACVSNGMSFYESTGLLKDPAKRAEALQRVQAICLNDPNTGWRR